jgi:hypothetical protein
MRLKTRITNLEKFKVTNGKGYLTFFYNYGEDSKYAEERARKDYVDSGGRMEIVEFVVALRDYSGTEDMQPSFNFVPIIL